MTITFPNSASPNTNWLREQPVAHRGLHDVSHDRFENTLSACEAARDAGYSIEVDLQPSLDTVPMVFHDYTLERLTEAQGDIRSLPAETLGSLGIGTSSDTIPTLHQLLDLIRGKVGIILELKGKPGNDDGFVRAVADALVGYTGDVGIMSFHHHILRDARSCAPHLLLGLTAEGVEDTYETHAAIAVEADIDFVSYELSNLDCRFVREVRNTGRPVLSWTVRSRKELDFSNKYADQPTFEGFLP